MLPLSITFVIMTFPPPLLALVHIPPRYANDQKEAAACFNICASLDEIVIETEVWVLIYGRSFSINEEYKR